MGDSDRTSASFDLDAFLPYLLNQAAEATSRAFQVVYKAEYGMTRSQWRVLAQLGRGGSMTAAAICRITHLEKTRVSRAVTSLESRGFLHRLRQTDDRRRESLSLTEAGRQAFARLGQLAADHDRALRASLGADRARELAAVLHLLIEGGQTGNRRIDIDDQG